MSTVGEFLPSAPFQESEIIPNKTDKDGHHYLKVLLLSNKKTRNNWIVPYQKIGDLPKEVIDSFVGLPFVNNHHYPYFVDLKERLVREGKQHEEVAKLLREQCQQLGLNYIDNLFYDPESSTLYGQLKILDEKENEYIDKHKLTSIKYTSPGVFGDSYESEDGTNVYDPATVRAFHLASVDIPAFPEQEAEVKAVCMNGNSESCHKLLAVAGFNSTDPLATGTPSENVNNPCSCNKNIEMSSTPPQQQQQQPQVNINTNPSQPETVNTNPTIQTNVPTGNLIEGAKNSTQEAIDAARKEAQKVVDENKKTDQEKNKPPLTEAEIELKKVTKDLEEERSQKLEMKNFFLEKMLISAIPRENFAKEDEYIQLKDSTKGLINKYGMSLEDSDWLISKVAKSVPAPASASSTEPEKKKNVGVAGFWGSTYNSDTITKSQQNVPQPASSTGSGSGIDDNDYPIPI